MKQNNKTSKYNQKLDFKKCGAITCINNVCGRCYKEKCELYEKTLLQEY